MGAFLVLRQFSTVSDPVPLSEAFTTAGGGRVLCDEGGVAPHRGLPVVATRRRGGEPLRNEVPGMPLDRATSLCLSIGELAAAEAEAVSEPRSCQPREDVRMPGHRHVPFDPCRPCPPVGQRMRVTLVWHFLLNPVPEACQRPYCLIQHPTRRRSACAPRGTDANSARRDGRRGSAS